MTIFITLVLLALSALFSGLNLGLMSLSPHELQRKMALGDPLAKRIYPVRRRGNLLLVTLLLGNVAVISILSIFLDSLLPGVLAAVLATLLVTIFGEIVPQALFARYSMQLGARFAWLVIIFMVLLYPIAGPLAWLLDRWLGEEMPAVYSKDELVKIIEEHAEAEDSDIEADEERIIRGALTFGDKRVGEVMTPRSQIVGLEAGERITAARIAQLERSGHSRFPVWEESPDRPVGMLYLRELASARGTKTARELGGHPVYFVGESSVLDHVLNAFLKKKHHLFIVVNEFEEVVGVVSIEDILEEIIEREIVGEFDRYEDLRAVAKDQATKRGKRADT